MAFVSHGSSPDEDSGSNARARDLRKLKRSFDDDCFVLDGDPDEPAAVGGDGDESEDLIIIREKGKLACRDFPHSRHECINFPFNSTPHAKYCRMCYCYVCDLPTPCSCWGDGVSSFDHCHSTDKTAFWKAKRKSLRQRSLVNLDLHSVAKVSDTTSGKRFFVDHISPLFISNIQLQHLLQQQVNAIQSQGSSNDRRNSKTSRSNHISTPN